MSRNKSLFLMGIFFLVVIICGNIFWRMFTRGNDEAFEKIKKETVSGLAKQDTVAVASPSVNAPTETLNTKQDLSQAETSPPAEEETAGWKTYVDEKNKFEFKYPDGAEVMFNGELIRVSQNNKKWKFRRYANKEKVDLQAWYEKVFSENERKNCTLTTATLTVGSYDTKYVNPNSGETLCEKAGSFSISTNKESVIRVETGDEDIENVNKILKTFKFKEGK
jgi:hypothetical protein